jgi:hypothetical protein
MRVGSIEDSFMRNPVTPVALACLPHATSDPPLTLLW